jgi:hypothetical protein
LAVTAPSAAELLGAWEDGLGETRARRALVLLAAARPGEELGNLTVGERDLALLDLRSIVFGPTVTALGDCAGCGERVEATFEAGDVRADAVAREVRLDGLRARVPTAEDLVAAEDAPDVEAARRVLLGRIVGEAEGGSLSEEAAAALGELLAEADPQADVRLLLACPDCGAAWEEPFEVDAFLWQELDAWAARLLEEVHALASAYGWSERDVLALSPSRRAAYLELAER